MLAHGAFSTALRVASACGSHAVHSVASGSQPLQRPRAPPLSPSPHLTVRLSSLRQGDTPRVLHMSDQSMSGRLLFLLLSNHWLVLLAGYLNPVTLPPVLLYSIPGSGNTYTRLLFEAFGVPAGSLYWDHRLLPVVSEARCDGVVKVHPGTHKPWYLFNRSCVQASADDKLWPGKCHFCRFEDVIVVLRDPVNTLFAMFNLVSSDTTGCRAATSTCAHVAAALADKIWDFPVWAAERAGSQVREVYETVYEWIHRHVRSRLWVQYERITAQNVARLGFH